MVRIYLPRDLFTGLPPISNMACNGNSSESKLMLSYEPEDLLNHCSSMRWFQQIDRVSVLFWSFNKHLELIYLIYFVFFRNNNKQCCNRLALRLEI